MPTYKIAPSTESLPPVGEETDSEQTEVGGSLYQGDSGTGTTTTITGETVAVGDATPTLQVTSAGQKKLGGYRANQNLQINSAALGIQLQTQARINGQTVTRGTSEYNILTGIEELQKKGLAVFSQDASDIVAQADTLMAAINITVEPQRASLSSETYDLKEHQTDREVVANPNMEDKNLENLRKQNIPATDKFPCTDDAFYELDPPPAQMIQTKKDEAQKREEPSAATKQVAGDLAALNIKKGGDNVKGAQFK